MENIPVTIEAAVTTSAQVQTQLDGGQPFRVLERTRMAEEVDPVVTLTAGQMLTLREVDNVEMKFEWSDVEGTPTLVLEGCRFGSAIDDPFDLFDVGEYMTSVGLINVEIRNCRKADGLKVDDFVGSLVGMLPS